MTRLRDVRLEEAEVVAQWHAAPASSFEDWSGPPAPGTESAARLPLPVGGGELLVTDDADAPLGTVSWRPVAYGPSPGSQAFEIGISLRPQARGHGHGSRAQRLLVDYLFATTPVHRVQASTDVGNVVEQAALVRAGFTVEGVLRAAQWRGGAFHDLVMYARLRVDA